MLPLADTPEAAALQALSCLDRPSFRPAAPVLLQQALARWPGDVQLIDALLTLAEELPRDAQLEGRALVGLLETTAATGEPRAPALLVAASRLAQLHDNSLRAFKLAVAALEQDPRHHPARSALLRLVRRPGVAAAVDDAMEGLAFCAFRGEIDKGAVFEVFDLLRDVSPLRRARSLLGA
jgi:hypothetical protein